MLYPNLQLNIGKVNGKKRPLYLYGVDESGTLSNELTDSNNNLDVVGGYFDKLPTPSIDTPKILAMVDDMSQEKLFGLSSVTAAALASAPISSIPASNLTVTVTSTANDQSSIGQTMQNERLRPQHNEFVAPSGGLRSIHSQQHHNSQQQQQQPPVTSSTNLVQPPPSTTASVPTLLHVSDSLQTPVVDMNNSNTINPFFQSLISPMDNYSCVAPNEVFGFPPPVSANSGVSGQQPQQHQMDNKHSIYQGTEMMQTGNVQHRQQQQHEQQQPQQQLSSGSMTNTSVSLATVMSSHSVHQTPDYYQQHSSIGYPSYAHLSTYPPTSSSNQLINPAVAHPANSASVSYIELKPRAQSDTSAILQQQQTGPPVTTNGSETILSRSMGGHFGDEILIPNTIDQLYASTCSSRNSYSLAPSPCPSTGSQTSNSTMDTKCGELKYGDYENSMADCSGFASASVSGGNNSQMRLGQLHAISGLGKSMSSKRPGGSSDQLHLLKKSRMTKKQKFDAMMSEEKSLIQDNDHLRKEIIELECKISMYRNSLMDVVKRGASK